MPAALTVTEPTPSAESAPAWTTPALTVKPLNELPALPRAGVPGPSFVSPPTPVTAPVSVSAAALPTSTSPSLAVGANESAEAVGPPYRRVPLSRVTTKGNCAVVETPVRSSIRSTAWLTRTAAT